jgi:hypothetical protein
VRGLGLTQTLFDKSGFDEEAFQDFQIMLQQRLNQILGDTFNDLFCQETTAVHVPSCHHSDKSLY